MTRKSAVCFDAFILNCYSIPFNLWTSGEIQNMWPLYKMRSVIFL